MPDTVGLPDKIKTLVDSRTFQYLVLLIILCAAVLVGVETYPDVAKEHQTLLNWLNRIILWLFVIEAILKLSQHGRDFYRYFVDPWNLFDFTIVVVCFLPVNASYAAVLRLARVMRALRLMTALPNLQVIVGALIKSIPSMGYVGILLTLNFYVYAVAGVFMFRENDPVHFRDLPTSMLLLFRVVTLEDWTDIMYINMYGSANYPGYEGLNYTGITPQSVETPIIGAAFFVSFVMFATMIMLNLFIGVIINSMDEARAEREREELVRQRAAGEEVPLDDELTDIDHQIDGVKEMLEHLRLRLEIEMKVKK